MVMTAVERDDVICGKEVDDINRCQSTHHSAGYGILLHRRSSEEKHQHRSEDAPHNERVSEDALYFPALPLLQSSHLALLFLAI